MSILWTTASEDSIWSQPKIESNDRVTSKFNQVESQVNSIRLSPKFNACKQSIDKAQRFVNKIDLISKDPENFVYEHFEKIRRKVDIRREELISKIHNQSNDIYCKIDQTHEDCIKIAKEINTISKDLENYKTDLNTLIQRFDSFEFNDRKYDDIISKVNILQPRFEDIFDEYMYSLLDNKDYELKDEEINLENVFGSFISYPKKVN